MLFSTIATVAALALANTVSGTPVPGAASVPFPVKDATRLARQTTDPHEADFRTFGVSGCYDENQGVYTLEKSNAYQCYQLVEPIGSLLLLDSGCTLTIYQDTACTESPVVVPTEICQNGSWKSYQLTC